MFVRVSSGKPEYLEETGEDFRIRKDPGSCQKKERKR